MLRFILTFVFVYLFFSFLNLYLSRRRRRDLDSRRRSAEPEDMVFDPQCQSYLPRGTAIHRGGHYFCSDKCAQLYLSRN